MPSLDPTIEPLHDAIEDENSAQAGPTSQDVPLPQALLYRSGRRFVTAGLLLLFFFFFSPFISCTVTETYPWSAQYPAWRIFFYGVLDYTHRAFPAATYTLVFYLLAGLVGMITGFTLLLRVPAYFSGAKLSLYSMANLATSILTLCPSATLICLVMKTPEYDLDWGFYGSVFAALYQSIAAILFWSHIPWIMLNLPPSEAEYEE